MRGSLVCAHELLLRTRDGLVCTHALSVGIRPLCLERGDRLAALRLRFLVALAQGGQFLDLFCQPLGLRDRLCGVPLRNLHFVLRLLELAALPRQRRHELALFGCVALVLQCVRCALQSQFRTQLGELLFRRAHALLYAPSALQFTEAVSALLLQVEDLLLLLRKVIDRTLRLALPPPKLFAERRNRTLALEQLVAQRVNRVGSSKHLLLEVCFHVALMHARRLRFAQHLVRCLLGEIRGSRSLPHRADGGADALQQRREILVRQRILGAASKVLGQSGNAIAHCGRNALPVREGLRLLDQNVDRRRHLLRARQSLDRGTQRGRERIPVHLPQRLGRQRRRHQLVRPMPSQHDKSVGFDRILSRRSAKGRMSFCLDNADHDERTLRSAHRPFGKRQVRCEVLVKRPDCLERAARQREGFRACERHRAGHGIRRHRHRMHVEHALLATS